MKHRQLWVKEGAEPRGMYTDEEGNDHDIEQMLELKKQVAASKGLKCPSCEDVGYTVEARPSGYDAYHDTEFELEQVQCEFCCEVWDSIFNRSKE